MINSRMKRVPLAILLFLASLSAEAAGLGRLTVLSGLGEPFSAEIEVFGAADEISSLSARIAPQSEYAAQGYERSAVLDTVRINVGKRADGSAVLKLNSAQPIEDPFMELLVQMDWQNGRLSREYNALLDPPGFGERALAQSLPVIPENKQAAAAPQTTKPRNSVANADTSSVLEKTTNAQPADTYLTKRGDTLRQIAIKVKLEDVSIEQMLVGLYQANTSAFTGGNINRLKAGQTLLVPNAEAVQAISQEDAVKEIKLQTANWSAYRNRLAMAAMKSTSQKLGMANSKTRASVTEEKPLAAETKYILKVSPGDIEYTVGKKATPKKVVTGN